MSLRAVCLLLLSLAFGAALSGCADTQAGTIGQRLPVCIARDAPGLTASGLFRTPERFDCATRQTDLGSGDYWALSAPLPSGSGVEWPARVRFVSIWQQDLALHVRYADGATTTIALPPHALSRRLQLGAIVEVRAPQRRVNGVGVPVARVLWKITGAPNLRGVMLGTSVAAPWDSSRSNITLAALYGAFGGLTLALMVYNLALWAALRHRFQLVYCAMLAAFAIYAFSSSGALAWAWPAIDNNDRIRISYVALSLSASFALAFARTFFEPRVFAGWLGRAANVVTAVLMGSGLAFAAFAPARMVLLDRLYLGSFIVLLAFIGAVLVRAWSYRSNYLRWFVLSWAAPIALAMMRIAAGLHLLPPAFLIDNSTLLSITLEALLSGIAIAYRLRQLTRERDEAREQEIAARLLADSDPLTGLANRRAFLRDAIGRAGEVTLLVVDIDHFKRVNDTIGHDGGDEVLRIIARTLRSVAPADGQIARLGGEEFAILAHGGGDALAAAVLDRVRAERMPFDIGVTVSIGTAIGTIGDEAAWKSLYRAADRALFDAKEAGRDRARTARLAA